MAAEFIAGLGAIKTAFDLAKGLKDIDNVARRNAAVIELQEKIFAAQSAQASLVERVGELEKEVANLKAWEGEKERYQLTEVGAGVFAYALKPETQSSEPPHLLCQRCYEDRRKSMLQATQRLDMRRRVHICPTCKTELAFSALPVRSGGETAN